MLCYQIDVSSAASGKHVKATKRRVRWRFGFANAKAIDAGKTGVECRGTEHEVTLVWSLTSGKRLVLMDQKEVHFSQGRRTEGKFNTSWEMQNGKVITIVAHAAPPLKQKPGFKQFDLQVNGCSYYSFSQIYQLGVTFRSDTTNAVTYSSSSSNSRSSTTRPRNSNYKASNSDAEMEWARNTYEQERRRAMDRAEENIAYSNRRDNAMNRDAPEQRHLGQVPTSITAHTNTIDLMSDPILPSTSQTLVSETATQQQDYFSTPQITHDEFQPSQMDPSQPPSYEAVWSSIMDAYDTAPAPAPAETYSVPTSEPKPTHVEENVHENDETVSRPKLTIETNIHVEPSNENKHDFFSSSMFSPSGVDEVSYAFHKIVNIDDLSSPADAKNKKLTMMSETKKDSRKSSNAIPPKAAGWDLGPSPSLAQLKKLQTGPTTTQRKEVMKAPVTQTPTPTAGGGALVVYGDNQNMGYNNYGPPPLQYTTGFGVGATIVQDNSPHAQHQPYNVHDYNQYYSQVRC